MHSSVSLIKSKTNTDEITSLMALITIATSTIVLSQSRSHLPPIAGRGWGFFRRQPSSSFFLHSSPHTRPYSIGGHVNATTQPINRSIDAVSVRHHLYPSVPNNNNAGVAFPSSPRYCCLTHIKLPIPFFICVAIGTLSNNIHRESQR